MIYDEYIDGACLRLEFEAEMVLQSLGERWSRFGRGEARGRHSARRDRWRKLEVHIKRSAKARAIENRTVQAGHRGIREHLDKQSQGYVSSGTAHQPGPSPTLSCAPNFPSFDQTSAYTGTCRV